MVGGVSRMAEKELLAAAGERCRAVSRKDKARILDEFIAVAGHQRKRGISSLRQSGEGESPLPEAGGRRTCDEVAREPPAVSAGSA